MTAERGLAEFEERTVGFEFENPVVGADGNPASADSMQEFWRAMAERGWRTKLDADAPTVIGAEKDFARGRVVLTSDCAACNLEMALPPCRTVGEAAALHAEVGGEAVRALASRGLRLLAFGIQPGTFSDTDAARIPSTHYDALRRAGSGDSFTNGIMLANSAHQVGVGVRVREAVGATNELLKMTGLVVALCGNSPVHGWSVLPWKEWRVVAWDFRFLVGRPGFERLTQFPARPFASLADYYAYYWDTPFMILAPLRGGRWMLPEEELTYGEYFSKARVPARDLDGEPRELAPEPRDFEVALRAMWPLVKPHLIVEPGRVGVGEFLESMRADALEDYLEGRLSNCYIEYRGAAASPRGEESALPALILGLVNNLEGLGRIGRLHSWDSWRGLVYQAAARGMSAEIDGRGIRPLLSRLVEAAAEGLSARPFGEAEHLNALAERVERGENPADRAVRTFGEGREKFLRDLSY